MTAQGLIRTSCGSPVVSWWYHSELAISYTVSVSKVEGKGVGCTAGEADESTLLSPSRDEDQDSISPLEEVVLLDAAFGGVAEDTCIGGGSTTREVVDASIGVAGVGKLEEALQIDTVAVPGPPGDSSPV